MPSSNKTGHLALNKWLGSDKPKKDDFNNDNTLVDAACKTMAGRISALETGAGATNSTIAGHTGNSGIHVTAAEKAAWNTPRDTMVFGSYSGTGATSRKITLGFRPKFGLLYAVGMGPVQADWNGEESKVYSAFFGQNGCSKSVALESDGFTVTHNASKPLDGCSFKLNESGVTYAYVAWQG